MVSVRIEELSAADIPKAIAWFRLFLKERGVIIPPKSALSDSLEALADFGSKIMSGGATMTRKEIYELHRAALPIDYLIRAVHKNAARLDKQFDWSAFRGQDVSLTRDAERSRERDLVFELLTLSACASFTDDARRGEPDVLATFRGRRFGLACKNLYSKNESQNEKTLSIGAKQIEGADIDSGFVFINFANLIAHEEFFPESGPPPFATPDEAGVAARVIGDAFFDRIMLKKPFVDRITAHATSDAERKLRGFMLLVPTLADVAGRPAPLYWTHINQSRSADADDQAFLLAVHIALQEIGRHRVA